jgi:hypothetical protein
MHMGNHYVPQYYLRGFSVEPASELIWVYRKGTSDIFKTAIHNIAQENNFYPEEMETYLANKIEGPANTVLQKVRDLELLTLNDKEILSKYMMVLWKRVPQHKNLLKEKAPEIMGPVFDRIDKELVELGEKYPTKKDLVEKHRKELQELRISKESDLLHDIWLANMPPDKAPRTLEVLSQMTWRFFTTGNDGYFITSDNPLFFFRWMGIGKEHSEVTFPITQNIALWTTWRIDLNEGYFSSRPQVIKEINRRTASIANEYLYSPRSETWISTLANKKAHRLNRIV